MREFIAKLAYLGRRMGECTDPIVECVFDGQPNTSSIPELACHACMSVCCLFPIVALVIVLMAAAATSIVWFFTATVAYLISIAIGSIFGIDLTYGTHANYVMLMTILVVSSTVAGLSLVCGTVAIMANTCAKH